MVAALSAGTQVEVHRRSGPTVHGKVASATDSGLVVNRSDKSAVTIQQQDITSVYLVGKRDVRRATLVGGAIGAALGAGIGIGICGPNETCTRPEGAASGAISFGLIGLTIGLLIGLHHNRTEIYHN